MQSFIRSYKITPLLYKVNYGLAELRKLSLHIAGLVFIHPFIYSVFTGSNVCKALY